MHTHLHLPRRPRYGTRLVLEEPVRACEMCDSVDWSAHAITSVPTHSLARYRTSSHEKQRCRVMSAHASHAHRLLVLGIAVRSSDPMTKCEVVRHTHRQRFSP